MGRLTKAELTTAIDILIHPQSGDESDIFGAHVTSIEAMKELKAYKDLEEQGRLIELPCKKVYRIINFDSPKYAFIDSIPIEMMPICELKRIDNGSVFFSAKEEAEAKLKELNK